MLKFSDGENFDLDGELRIEARQDGYYVVGGGMMIPVSSRAEGEEIIQEMTAKKLKPE